MCWEGRGLAWEQELEVFLCLHVCLHVCLRAQNALVTQSSIDKWGRCPWENLQNSISLIPTEEWRTPPLVHALSRITYTHNHTHNHTHAKKPYSTSANYLNPCTIVRYVWNLRIKNNYLDTFSNLMWTEPSESISEPSLLSWSAAILEISIAPKLKTLLYY